MNYILFEEFITLQALLKDLGIIPSGGAIKGFLSQELVLFNGEQETRRGKKIRVGDTITLPNQAITIQIIAPSADELSNHQEEKAEKERVAKLVKSMNKDLKKGNKPQNSPRPAVRFPGT
ncbi:S4 domain protein YaaA [Streptococcus rupicaprae]|uniref:S4 domain protein YaaA n=1 Tax=Streptococcus rupicaprae TaxID=759619 RepID=A0ABV2FHN1_9STRE